MNSMIQHFNCFVKYILIICFESFSDHIEILFHLKRRPHIPTLPVIPSRKRHMIIVFLKSTSSSVHFLLNTYNILLRGCIYTKSLILGGIFHCLHLKSELNVKSDLTCQSTSVYRQSQSIWQLQMD